MAYFLYEVIILNSNCMKDLIKSLSYTFFFRERERGGKKRRRRERHTPIGCLLKVKAWEESATPVCALGWESKPRPFSPRADALTTEPNQPVLSYPFIMANLDIPRK